MFELLDGLVLHCATRKPDHVLCEEQLIEGVGKLRKQDLSPFQIHVFHNQHSTT